MDKPEQTKTDDLILNLLKLQNDLCTSDSSINSVLYEASDRLKQYQTITKNLLKVAQWLKEDLVICEDYNPSKTGITIALLAAIKKEVNAL